MDNDRVNRLARWLHAAQNRRTMVGGGLAALGLAMSNAQGEARKKRKKKRKKKQPPPSLCEKLCGFNCAFCIFRADGTPLCGDGVVTACLNCGSDDDCDPENHPFCISHYEFRVSGSITNSCGEGSVCSCGPAALGVCSDAIVCGAAG